MRRATIFDALELSILSESSAIRSSLVTLDAVSKNPDFPLPSQELPTPTPSLPFKMAKTGSKSRTPSKSLDAKQGKANGCATLLLGACTGLSRCVCPVRRCDCPAMQGRCLFSQACTVQGYFSSLYNLVHNLPASLSSQENLGVELALQFPNCLSPCRLAFSNYFPILVVIMQQTGEERSSESSCEGHWCQGLQG